MSKVTVRPGDTITHRHVAGEFRVVTRKAYKALSGRDADPGKIPAFNRVYGYRCWRLGHYAHLNGDVVTHYIDDSLPMADAVFDRDPAVPRLESQKPDEDGMVTGWDGRKVWL
jgi:hypothetical protein